jgi:hypothetical protein
MIGVPASWRALCLGVAALVFCATAQAHGKSFDPVVTSFLIGLLVVCGLAWSWVLLYGIAAFSGWWVLLWLVWHAFTLWVFGVLVFLALFTGEPGAVLMVAGIFAAKFAIELFLCRRARRKQRDIEDYEPAAVDQSTAAVEQRNAQ